MDDGEWSIVFLWEMKDICVPQPTSGLLSLLGKSKSHQLKQWTSYREILVIWCDVESFGLCGLHPFANNAGITLTVPVDHYTEVLYILLALELWQYGFDPQMCCF